MLLDFLVCDDVRTEVGDKFTLVGIYGNTIRLDLQGAEAKWPVLIPKLGFFVRTGPVTSFTPDHFSLSFTFNGSQIAKFEGELKVADPAGPIILAVVASPFPVHGSGELRFNLVYRAGERSESVAIDRAIVIETTGAAA